MNIRQYCESDEEAVIALWQRVFADNPPHSQPAANIRQKLAVQPELFLVAEVDGRVAGTTLAGYDGHRGWLYAVAVDPDCRRRGIGRALVRHAEKLLAELGCPKVNLQVRAHNTGVVAFYQTLGYDIEERVSMGKLLDEH